ncbi:MAG: hypothetical protein PF637_11225 [Spirochaetes bacterium]|jgi:hypothetical protein|nr:hypothetical protein [Spirochaetota bacterium]
MKRLVVILILIPVLLWAQAKEDEEKKSDRSGSTTEKDLPTQMVQSEEFEIRHISFNKKVDPRGRGELLQVDFQLENEVDISLDLYIHIVATNEELVWVYDSFGKKKITPKRIDTKYIKSLPEDVSQYEYEIEGEKSIIKYPKNIKTGVSPDTGKAYHLTDYYAFRYEFLSHYRRKYVFFNKVTILIFDDEEKLMFRQSYSLDSFRR